MPLGTTTPKGRGRESAASTAQQRGDPHTVSGSTTGTEPSAAGADVLRGYGPDAERAPATNAIAPARLPSIEPVPDSRSDTGSLLVEYRGLLGLDTTMLRVPLDAVRDVLPDSNRLVLAYPREECHQRFGGYDETQGDPATDADATSR
jgi:hypothetical protein